MSPHKYKLPALLVLLLFCRSAFSAEPLEREVYRMGTILKVILFEPDREKGIVDIESLIQVIEETEDQLSTWRPTSELSRLNQQEASRPFPLTPSLCSLMVKLQQWVQATEGTFDPSVGRLLKTWGIQDVARIPTQEEIADALQLTGFHNLQLEMHNCSVTKIRAVLLDAGAFGKGEALDRAEEVARRNHLAPLLLDFGGQLAVWLTPPGEKGWSTAIADPFERTKRSWVQIRFTSGSLSTSGGSEHDRMLAKRRIGHIVDPKTGYPVESFGSVTVWHSGALEADILSTALYVMGPERGFPWAVKNRIAACFLILKGHRILKTPEWIRSVN